MRGLLFVAVGAALLLVALARGDAWAALGSVAAGAVCAVLACAALARVRAAPGVAIPRERAARMVVTAARPLRCGVAVARLLSRALTRRRPALR